MEPEAIDVFLDAGGAASGAARFGLVNALAEIGRRQTEGGPPIGGQPAAGDAGMTPKAARAEMDRILHDPVNAEAYNNVTDPRHREITTEITRLGKIERGKQ